MLHLWGEQELHKADVKYVKYLQKECMTEAA